MKVVIIFKDKNGSMKPSDDIELDLDSAQVTALLQSDIVSIPVEFGNSQALKRGKIEERVFDVFRGEPILKVTIKEH